MSKLVFNEDTGVLQLDVLAVEMPAAPTERRFYGQLLLALNAPYRPGDRLAAVEFTALTLLRRVAPKVIVVDEVTTCWPARRASSALH